MLIGPFQPIDARRQEIEAGRSTSQLLREYWTARSELEQILNGRVPQPSGRSSRSTESCHEPVE